MPALPAVGVRPTAACPDPSCASRWAFVTLHCQASDSKPTAARHRCKGTGRTTVIVLVVLVRGRDQPGPGGRRAGAHHVRTPMLVRMAVQRLRRADDIAGRRVRLSGAHADATALACQKVTTLRHRHVAWSVCVRNVRNMGVCGAS
ncbi:hypothetical protein FMEAI12_2500002 [Parafrankia sp. Ea1.12]|nr:hypothetical protein FMEAI12_2500002 [Parafrankia sp. Ea1.12]